MTKNRRWNIKIGVSKPFSNFEIGVSKPYVKI